MNITLDTQLFAQELRLLAKIAPGKPTIPILANIMLKADFGRVTMTATDLEISLTTECPANIGEPGVVTLPVKKLLDLVEQLPAADLHLTLQKGQVYLACGAFKSRLQSIDAESFPPMPAVEGNISALPSGPLRSLIARTRYAISDSTTKYLLAGSLLSIKDGEMAMVATDAKRLSIASSPCPVSDAKSAIIPVKTLDIIASHSSYSGDVKFSIGPRHMFFEMGERLIISRMLDGTFPDYTRIVPRDNDKTIKLARAPFAAALRRVGLIADDTDEAVYIDIATDTLAITAQSANIGDADEILPITYTGPNLKIRCNWRHLLHFMGESTSPEIIITAKDALSSIMLIDGPNYINVLTLLRG